MENGKIRKLVSTKSANLIITKVSLLIAKLLVTKLLVKKLLVNLVICTIYISTLKSKALGRRYIT